MMRSHALRPIRSASGVVDTKKRSDTRINNEISSNFVLSVCFELRIFQYEIDTALM